MPIPTFLIIGAMKSGTSSLHEYLSQHPDVFMSKRKELDYFTRRYDRGLPWYQSKFQAATEAKVAGESSPNYLKAHMWPDTARRIHEMDPEIRLICVLRNPVDRTLSNYLHDVRRRRETGTFSEDAHPDSRIVMTSRYAWQLERYLEFFHRDQIKPCSTEELAQEPQRVLSDLFGFLGVDHDVSIDTSLRSNVTATELAGSGRSVPPDPELLVDDEGIAMTHLMRTRLAETLAPDAARLTEIWPDAPHWKLT